ncbi:MAG: hypothetical protein QME21_10055 [Anaerolineales bacterium]|nr:hypothetical protein [Anaerolineales bacterium]
MPSSPKPAHAESHAATALSGRANSLSRYRARYVRAGRIRRPDGEYTRFAILPQALQQAVEQGLFCARPVFLNHAAWPGAPDLANLIGFTARSAAYDPAQQSVDGEIELIQTPAGRLAQTLIEATLAEPAVDIGLSIVFYPAWGEDPASGEPAIVGVRHVESVDLVFQPAADGRILQALSAEAETSEIRQTKVCHLQLSQFQLVKGPQTMSDERSTLVNAPATPPPAPESEAEKWQQAALWMLAVSGLPEASRQRLAAQTFESPQALQSAIQSERQYLAALQENQVVQIGNQPPRSPHIGGMRTSLDRIQLALEALLCGSQPPAGVQPLTGVRELYHLLSGDYEMTGLFQGERVQFANVNSSTMANLVANVLNKRVAQEFQQYQTWWTPIVVEEDFSSLQAIKWTLLGGVGELPTVDEGAAYSELSWDDSAESGAFVKKGGYLGLTLEAIDKDETGRLRAAPRALAQAAWLTLSKSISAIFTANSGVGPTLSDGKALFHADHGNLATSALTLSAYNAARAAMRKQTELNSGERLGALTSPKYLLVPPDLEMTALQILASELDYTYTLSNGQAAPVNPNTQGNLFNERLAFARSRVIVVDLWTDANDWAAVADPRLYPTIGVGYRYGRTPEIFSVASPTAGLMFTNDTMPIKVRFFYAVAPIDYRGLYKSNVA